MPCGMTHTCTVVTQLRMHTHWICTAVLTLLLCGLLSTVCVFVYLCVSMQRTVAGWGGGAAGSVVAHCARSSRPLPVRAELSQLVSFRLAWHPDPPRQSATGNDGT